MYAITAGRDNGLTSNYISGIVQDTDGTIWVSAWEGGVFKTDSVVKSPKTVKFRLIEKNGDGRLLSNGKSLFYAIGNTLWRFNGSNDGKQPVEEVNQYTANKTITALLSSDKGNCIWIGADEQLLKYTPESRKVKKIEVNITSPKKIINLEQDKYGNIWGTTQNSVFRIDAWNDEMITIPVSHSSPFKGFYPYCSASVEHGKILFGGDNAYIEINPSTVTVPEMNPQIYITALRIDNQIMQPVGSSGILSSDIAFMDKLDLKYYQNSLTFEFSTLDYLFPDKGQFRYRLKPVQEKWIYNPGNNNFAVFANVKPGEYTLEVQGTNNLGVWSHKRELYIDIAPSIWLSNTFLALYVVLFLAMTYFIFRVYNYRQRLKNELQIVRLEKQHSEALYQAKIRFFTNISHEFRTPLGLIISPLKQLAGSDIRDAKLHKIIELAQRNAQRLYKLINQLLDFRKIESSQLHLVTEDVEMVSFTREVFESFDNLARRQKINYHFDTGVGQLNCHIDREKVETIIFNLLSNAFKYTPESGGIGVKLDVSDAFERQSAIVLSVEDSGPGIPKEDSEHIFELFYQTDESKNTKTGSGIGLTLAMEYAQLHGGTINLESRPGKGSRFILLLPLVESSIFEEEIYVEEEKSSEGITAVSAPEKAPEDAKRILIVDDNQDFRDYLEMNLESDFRLLFAENGFKGLKLARKEMPDLIISDIMMPVMDGADLCGNIKTDVATAHIPIILLTAKTLDIDKTEGMSKGADMYITKPFDLEFLRSSIQSIFRREEQMTRYIESRLLLSPPAREDKQHPDELFLKKVMSVIERNVGNPGFSVEMISETMGMSSTHLYRKLKAITGFSTSEIINSYRMQKAAQMLTNKEGNITEVMYAVGFSSLSSFSKSFKAKYGVAPTKYKSTV
jgi:signal transduction histidine kinase/CheY-like chemotaxis protein